MYLKESERFYGQQKRSDNRKQRTTSSTLPGFYGSRSILQAYVPPVPPSIGGPKVPSLFSRKGVRQRVFDVIWQYISHFRGVFGVYRHFPSGSFQYFRFGTAVAQPIYEKVMEALYRKNRRELRRICTFHGYENLENNHPLLIESNNSNSVVRKTRTTTDMFPEYEDIIKYQHDGQYIWKLVKLHRVKVYHVAYVFLQSVRKQVAQITVCINCDYSLSRPPISNTATKNNAPSSISINDKKNNNNNNNKKMTTIDDGPNDNIGAGSGSGNVIANKTVEEYFVLERVLQDEINGWRFLAFIPKGTKFDKNAITKAT